MTNRRNLGEASELIAAFEQAVLNKAKIDTPQSDGSTYPMASVEARGEVIRTTNDLFHALCGHSPHPAELKSTLTPQSLA